MEDLLKLKDAQIEALTKKLTEANILLAELAQVLEVQNFEIVEPTKN